MNEVLKSFNALGYIVKEHSEHSIILYKTREYTTDILFINLNLGQFTKYKETCGISYVYAEELVLIHKIFEIKGVL